MKGVYPPDRVGSEGRAKRIPRQLLKEMRACVAAKGRLLIVNQQNHICSIIHLGAIPASRSSSAVRRSTITNNSYPILRPLAAQAVLNRLWRPAGMSRLNRCFGSSITTFRSVPGPPFS